MVIRFRQYSCPEDYRLVDEFLIQNHQPGNTDGNWVEPAWEYMHYHPWLDGKGPGHVLAAAMARLLRRHEPAHRADRLVLRRRRLELRYRAEMTL